MNVDPSLGMTRARLRPAVPCALGLLLGVLWTSTLISQSLADESPAFRWSRKVVLPQLAETALLAIPFDSGLFSATQADFADLRLRDDRGGSVAFIVRAAPTTRERTVRKTWRAKQRGAKPLGSGGLEILLDLDDDSPTPQGLQVISPLRDFEHQVRVFSSADGSQWEPAGPPTVIFDYSRFVDVRSVSAPIAAGAHRHFRLVIDDVTAEQASQLLELTRRLSGPEEIRRDERTTVVRRPFRVDAVEFYRDDVERQPSGAQTVAYPVADLRISQDAKHKQTLVEFSSQREPLTSLKLLTDATNFSRSATLQVPQSDQPGAAWRTVAAATLSEFSLEAMHKSDLSMTFSEQRHPRYRLVLDNRDSPAVPIRGVEVEGPVYQLVFLGAAGQRLTLDYGSPDARGATYDTAAVRASLAAGYVPEIVKLGEAVEKIGVAPAFRWSSLIEDARVVIGVIAVLIVILGWGLYRASRRLESTPRE